MAVLDTAIHALAAARKTWMRGTSPRMTWRQTSEPPRARVHIAEPKEFHLSTPMPNGILRSHSRNESAEVSK